jgi:hypothetical protein
MKWIDEIELARQISGKNEMNLPEWHDPAMSLFDVEAITTRTDNGNAECDGTTHS